MITYDTLGVKPFINASTQRDQREWYHYHTRRQLNVR